MITLEYLVVCIADKFKLLINKSFVNRSSNRCKLNLRIQISKDAIESFQLLRLLCKDEELIACPFVRFQVFNE